MSEEAERPANAASAEDGEGVVVDDGHGTTFVCMGGGNVIVGIADYPGGSSGLWMGVAKQAMPIGAVAKASDIQEAGRKVVIGFGPRDLASIDVVLSTLMVIREAMVQRERIEGADR